MKHRTVNDYFKQQWPRLILFAAFTLGVSFFAPLKNFQLKWLIDSKSKQEALGYMGLVFAITFSSWFFERLSRRSFTRIACGAVEQVRQRILEQVLYRTVAQYNAEGDAAYLSLLTTCAWVRSARTAASSLPSSTQFFRIFSLINSRASSASATAAVNSGVRLDLPIWKIGSMVIARPFK